MENVESKVRVLIVEDEVPLARALDLKLESAGFDVMRATDGQEAIDILENERFDLLLLDIIMPRLDGIGVLAWLREHQRKERVIALSNLSNESDIERAKSNGAEDFFIKTDIPLSEVVEHVLVMFNRS